MLNLTNAMLLKGGSDGLRWGWDAMSTTPAQILTYSNWHEEDALHTSEQRWQFFLHTAGAVTKCFITSAPGQETPVTVESVGAWHPLIQKEERKGDSCNPGKLQGKCHHVQRQAVSFLWAEHRHWSRDSPGFINIICCLCVVWIQIQN